MNASQWAKSEALAASVLARYRLDKYGYKKEESMSAKTMLKPFAVVGTDVLKDTDVADLLVSAFEGGSNYWIERTDIVNKGGTEFGSHDQSRDDYYPWVILAPMGSGSIRIKPEDDDKSYTLDRAAILRGLQLMRSKYHKHWCDFMTENSDATTGDVLLQLALLGDIVYG